jgi:hypothetical protein
MSPAPAPHARRCNTTQGLSPFTVSPRFSAVPTARGTTEYCFQVGTIPTNNVVPYIAAEDVDAALQRDDPDSADYAAQWAAWRGRTQVRHTIAVGGRNAKAF